MTRQAKRAGWAIAAVVAVAITLWVSWLPIWTSLVVAHGAPFFRDNFQPGRDLHAAIHEDTWATWHFAGTKGLPEIKRLSQDPSLIPSGRSTASNLYLHISTGGHLPCVRWELAEGGLQSFGLQYYRYLLRRDTSFLKRRGVPVPEGMQQ